MEKRKKIRKGMNQKEKNKKQPRSDGCFARG